MAEYQSTFKGAEIDDAITKARATQQLITYCESSTTATRNYAIGDFVIVANVLYKVTASIASGDTIAAGVNVNETTLNAEIDAINDKFDVVPGVNLYDEAHNGEVQSDPQYTIGTVYLDGQYGDFLLSCYRDPDASTNRTSYFTQIKAYDAEDTATDITPASGSVENNAKTRAGKRFTVPQGSVKITFRYRTSYSGGELIKDVMVTQGRECTNFYEPYDEHTEINDSLYITAAGVNAAAYMAPDGDDTNDGLTPETAVATLQKAFEISRIVKAKRGMYTLPRYGTIVRNVDGAQIIPYDPDEAYAHAHPNRQKIEFIGADVVAKADLSVSGGIYSTPIGYGAQFSEVFTAKSKNPVYDADLGAYNANIFVLYADISKKVKLKPIIPADAPDPSDPLAQETNAFYWDGSAVYCKIADDDFVGIAVSTANSGIRFSDCDNVILEDVIVRYAYNNEISIKRGNNAVLKGCEGSYSGIGMGILCEYTDAVLEACYATHNAVDGFNIHGYGTVDLNDCVAEYNYDDGVSHHNGNHGTIRGGRYTGNGKGGICPAYGAAVNVYGAVCNGNGHGIAYLTTDNGHAAMTGIINGCLMIGNTNGLTVQSLASVTAVNCVYSGNTTDKNVTGTLVEY